MYLNKIGLEMKKIGEGPKYPYTSKGEAGSTRLPFADCVLKAMEKD